MFNSNEQSSSLTFYSELIESISIFQLPCMGGGGGLGHYKTESKQYNKNISTSASSPRRQLQQSRYYHKSASSLL